MLFGGLQAQRRLGLVIALFASVAYLRAMFTRKNLVPSLRPGVLARLVAIPVLGLAGGAPAPLLAQSIVATGPSQLEVRLLPGELSDGERVAGLALSIAPGWKTYWRMPGEAGVPPRFDWSGSRNLAALDVLWPTPEIFESFGMMSIGYGDEVVLPIRLVPEDPGQPITLALEAEFGVCREICIFEEVRFAIERAPGEAVGAAEVAAAVARVPEAGRATATCRIAGAGADRRFSAEIAHGAVGSAPYVVLEGPAGAWFHGVETAPLGAASGGALAVEAMLTLDDPVAWITRSDVRITLLGEGYAADIRGCIAPG